MCLLMTQLSFFVGCKNCLMLSNDGIFRRDTAKCGSGQLCRASTASMHFFIFFKQVKTHLVSTSCIYIR